jgi:hypothetical protein
MVEIGADAAVDERHDFVSETQHIDKPSPVRGVRRHIAGDDRAESRRVDRDW